MELKIEPVIVEARNPIKELREQIDTASRTRQNASDLKKLLTRFYTNEDHNYPFSIHNVDDYLVDYLERGIEAAEDFLQLCIEQDPSFIGMTLSKLVHGNDIDKTSKFCNLFTRYQHRLITMKRTQEMMNLKALYDDENAESFTVGNLEQYIRDLGPDAPNAEGLLIVAADKYLNALLAALRYINDPERVLQVTCLIEKRIAKDTKYMQIMRTLGEYLLTLTKTYEQYYTVAEYLMRINIFDTCLKAPDCKNQFDNWVASNLLVYAQVTPTYIQLCKRLDPTQLDSIGQIIFRVALASSTFENNHATPTAIKKLTILQNHKEEAAKAKDEYLAAPLMLQSPDASLQKWRKDIALQFYMAILENNIGSLVYLIQNSDAGVVNKLYESFADYLRVIYAKNSFALTFREKLLRTTLPLIKELPSFDQIFGDIEHLFKLAQLAPLPVLKLSAGDQAVQFLSNTFSKFKLGFLTSNPPAQLPPSDDVTGNPEGPQANL